MLETYRAISDHGIKVTVDGHGADELFSGYGHLNSLYKVSNLKQTAEIAAIIDSLSSGKYKIDKENMKINYINKKLFIFFYSYIRKPFSHLKVFLENKILNF